MSIGLTVSLPLSISGEGDFSQIKEYPDLVKQNLKNLALTIPGERPMDINFGAGIQRFLFEPNVAYTLGELETEIGEKVSEYMPFLDLEEIRVIPDQQNENLIRVQIFYVIVPLEVEDNLLLTITRNLALK